MEVSIAAGEIVGLLYDKFAGRIDSHFGEKV